jgi:hypothetical protein
LKVCKKEQLLIIILKTDLREPSSYGSQVSLLINTKKMKGSFEQFKRNNAILV